MSYFRLSYLRLRVSFLRFNYVNYCQTHVETDCSYADHRESCEELLDEGGDLDGFFIIPHCDCVDCKPGLVREYQQGKGPKRCGARLDDHNSLLSVYRCL
jgi:hypothetical protein